MLWTQCQRSEEAEKRNWSKNDQGLNTNVSYNEITSWQKETYQSEFIKNETAHWKREGKKFFLQKIEKKEIYIYFFSLLMTSVS